MRISASILSLDFSSIVCYIELFTRCGCDYIHIDIADGHFVPNLTFGPCVIRSLRRFSSLDFDVHLMIQNPQDHIEQYSDAGSDMLTFHYETIIHHDALIKKIKHLGKKVGIAICPSTDPSLSKYIIPEIDTILIMTVNPGFSGQNFLPSQLKKIEHVKEIILQTNSNALISVDGGINIQTAQQARKAGADIATIGSALPEKDEKLLAEFINIIHSI